LIYFCDHNDNYRLDGVEYKSTKQQIN